MENQLVCEVGNHDDYPHVHVSLGNRHIGTFFGTIRKSADEFSVKHGIIDIVNTKNRIVSTIWNVDKIIEEVKQ